MMSIIGTLLVMSLAQSAAPPAPGTISGRVTSVGTNAPIAGARVMVMPMFQPTTARSGPINFPQPGITDDNGRFSVSNLAPGEYRVDVQKTGFAPMQDPMTKPTTYAVGAGQSIDVSIVLQKGAVISGKLLDQKGEPVAGTKQ